MNRWYMYSNSYRSCSIQVVRDKHECASKITQYIDVLFPSNIQSDNFENMNMCIFGMQT